MKKKRKGSRKKKAKKGKLTKAQRSAAAKKGWRKRKRTSNPSKKRASSKRKSAKRKSTKRRTSKRRSPRRDNPSGVLTIPYNFDAFTDALPATIAGAAGFTLSGIVDAISGGRITEKIAEVFAGKTEAGQQKRPDYQDRAQAEVVLDAASFFGLWILTDRMESLESARTPLLIGSGIRLVRGLADAIIKPKEPTGLAAGARRVMDLPAIQAPALKDASKLPGDKIILVRWDYKLKGYVGPDGKVVKYTVPKDGVATTADGKVLVDADTRAFIVHSKGFMDGTYEEWNLALNGAGGYDMGSVIEDWSMQPSLPTPQGGMHGYEDWNVAPDHGGMHGDSFDQGFAKRF
jgi:hypothetical protein